MSCRIFITFSCSWRGGKERCEGRCRLWSANFLGLRFGDGWSRCYFGGECDLLFFFSAALATGFEASRISVGLGKRDGFCGLFGGLWCDPFGAEDMSFGACRAIQFTANFCAVARAFGYGDFERLNVSVTTSYIGRASQLEGTVWGICPIVGKLRRVMLTNGHKSRQYTRIL